MNIDITPSLHPDLTLWGKPLFFDFKTYPGAVVLQFENDVVMTIPASLFEVLKFSVPDKMALIAGPDKDAKAARVTPRQVMEHHSKVLATDNKKKIKDHLLNGGMALEDR